MKPQKRKPFEFIDSICICDVLHADLVWLDTTERGQSATRETKSL